MAYDWPIVQHQLFGGFPTVSHQRAHLEPSPDGKVLLKGVDDDGNEYPIMVETPLSQGTTILSAESIGAAFNSYMVKCAGHPSIWMSRAMELRDFLRANILRTCGSALQCTAETDGNVATYWWKNDDGYVALAVNHEYSEARTCTFELPEGGRDQSIRVYGAKEVCQSCRERGVSATVSIEPASAAVIVSKRS